MDLPCSTRRMRVVAVAEVDKFDSGQTSAVPDVMAVASSRWTIVVDLTQHCTIAVAVAVADDDNLAVAGIAFVGEDYIPAVPLTYYSHPTLGWRMQPCRLSP